MKYCSSLIFLSCKVSKNDFQAKLKSLEAHMNNGPSALLDTRRGHRWHRCREISNGRRRRFRRSPDCKDRLLLKEAG